MILGLGVCLSVPLPDRIISKLVRRGEQLSTINSEVLGVRHLTDETFVLTTTRSVENVRAGQCFSIGTDDLAINREYSIYSGEHEDHLEFLIRSIEGGAVSTRLAQLKPGDTVEVGGPYGSFCLDERTLEQNSYVFVCSGTGIAPFASFVKSFQNLDYRILHGVRFEEETYEDWLYDKDRYLAQISRPRDGSPSRRVTDGLRGESFPANTLFYLCGNREMIVDSVAVLRSRNVPGGSIFMETFF